MVSLCPMSHFTIPEGNKMNLHWRKPFALLLFCSATRSVEVYICCAKGLTFSSEIYLKGVLEVAVQFYFVSSHYSRICIFQSTEFTNMQLTNLSKHSSLKAAAIWKSHPEAFFSHLEMLLTQFKSRRQMRFGSTPTRRSVFSLSLSLRLILSPACLLCFLYFCVRWNWSGDDVERDPGCAPLENKSPFPLFLPVWNTRSPEHTHELSLTAAAGV
jgi:hypothetical protein